MARIQFEVRLTEPDSADLLIELAAAAKAWWMMKKPITWNEVEHMASPTINCVGPQESRLARVVANLVEKG